jgi:hypothetical protein
LYYNSVTLQNKIAKKNNYRFGTKKEQMKNTSAHVMYKPECSQDKLTYKLFWTWDHSTNWVLNVPGTQNSGVGNAYTKNPEIFVRDYKCAVNWCAANGVDAIGIVGLLRDRHGGVKSAKDICAYARGHGVRIYLIAGLYAYGGIYYEGDSPWSLDKFLADNPDCMGRTRSGEPLFWEFAGSGGFKRQPHGCSSNPKLNAFVLDSLDWIFKEIPELGGIQMESGDTGVCMCKKCFERRGEISDGAKNTFIPTSFADMAKIYPKAADAVWSRSSDAWVICETYHHFLDKPCDAFFNADNPLPVLQELLQMPEKTFFQWKCDECLEKGTWDGSDKLPEPMQKFRHVMRAHSGTQWRGGRHTLAIDKIRRQCLLSFESGLQGVSIFGEGAPFHANVEFNYLAMQYFADAPTASVRDFAETVMAPRLGGLGNAEKYLEFAALNLEPKKIPSAMLEIAKILPDLKDYDAIRRWTWISSFLNSFYWASRQTDYEKRIDPKSFNML